MIVLHWGNVGRILAAVIVVAWFVTLIVLLIAPDWLWVSIPATGIIGIGVYEYLRHLWPCYHREHRR